ncbi:hypothetical protein ABVK25_006252 [Lepraria finkii]|uniref:Zn(2)-C6 fungal-type domain-containing protein n=1 Tax=Lepraria finkii TaxID=1340010 RepID=A0ABR4B9S5_9LECA
MSSNSTAREERSPHDETPASKRRRIAFSCLDCRRRKLKCDRIYPSCTRCQKGGHPQNCTYDTEAVDTLNQSSGTRSARDLSSSGGLPRAVPRLPSVARSFAGDDGDEIIPTRRPGDATAGLYAQDERIRQLENRIIGLERIINGNGRVHWPRSTRSPELTQAGLNPSLDPREAVDKESMIFRGKGFKTQFYGASYHMSYLSHLPELRMVMKDMIVHHPALARVQMELNNAKTKGAGQEDTIPLHDQGLASLFPHRKITDQLVQIYIDNFETTCRVLHLPSFWDEYAKFWSAPREARPAFVALLLLIIATTNCIREKGPTMFRGDSSVERETAIMWIRNCDAWLRSQSQKHTTLIIFQLHCLSFMAKQMNSVKRKRIWTSAGILTRQAMSAGLHRDAHIVNLRHGAPSFKRVSVFEQEMRRRIWTTISELELQADLDRGMPSMTRDLVEDCGPPHNIDDDEMDPSSEQLPNPRPSSHFTRSSYQNLSRSSWSLRIEVTSLINGPNSQMPYEDVLLYDKKIMQCLDEIPHWNGHESLVSRILLQIQLQQLLLFLHKPYARDEPWGSRYDYSAIVHLRSAMTIIDLHDQLLSTGNSFLCLFRNDSLSAALSICYNVSISNPKPERGLPSRSSIVQLSGDPLQYLERALAMLEDKIMCLGVGLQEYYCVCAIIGLLKSRISRDQSRNEEERSADKVTRMIQRVLATQDNYSAAATLASLPNMAIMAPNGLPNGNGIPQAMPNSQIVPHHQAMPPSQPISIENPGLLEDFGQDLEGLDLTNITGWDLEAFWNF